MPALERRQIHLMIAQR